MKTTHPIETATKAALCIGMCGAALCAETKPNPTAETGSGQATDGSATLPPLEVTARKVAVDSSFGTKVPTPIIKTPQSISVIPRGEMEERGVRNLNDIVSYTSGVVSEAYGMDSRAENIRVRGYQASGLGGKQTYLDGMRSGSGGQWTGVQFDPFGMESVEIVKGPSAVLYGQVPPGGLINVMSKLPSANARNSAMIQYGSHNTILGAFDMSGANEPNGVLFRVLGLARSGDSEVDDVEMKRQFVAPSLTWNISDAAKITFLTQYQRDTGGSTYQFLPQTGSYRPARGGFRISRSTLLGEPDWNTYDRSQLALGYQFEARLDDTFSIHQSYRYTNVDSDYKGVVTRGDANITTGDLPRRAIWGYGESENHVADLHLKSEFTTGEVEHTLLTGVDFFHSDWDHTRKLVNANSINIYNPVHTGLTAAQMNTLVNGKPQQIYDVIEEQTGVYLQEQAVLGDLYATLGLRHDWYSVDFTDQATNNAVDIDPASTTWRGGLLYAFESGFSPYLSYSTSFDTSPYTSVDVNNKPLEESIESEQWEIGLKYKPTSYNAIFTASAFRLDEENLPTTVMVSTDPANPWGKNLYDQVGEARTMGMELEARVELYKGFNLVAAYTYMNTEITRSSALGTPEGNELPGVPEHSASLWLGYAFQAGALEGLNVGAGTRYVGSSYGDAANLYSIPSFTLFDAAIGYDFGRKFASLEGLSARLSATNLADKRYVASTSAPSAAWYGSGRNINFSLQYAW